MNFEIFCCLLEAFRAQCSSSARFCWSWDSIESTIAVEINWRGKTAFLAGAIQTKLWLNRLGSMGSLFNRFQPRFYYTRPKLPFGRQGLVTDAGSQLTSFDPKTLRHWHGPQPTSIDPKTLRHWHGAQLTSIDPKNVTLLTWGPTDLLDV